MCARKMYMTSSPLYTVYTHNHKNTQLPVLLSQSNTQKPYNSVFCKYECGVSVSVSVKCEV